MKFDGMATIRLMDRLERGSLATSEPDGAEAEPNGYRPDRRMARGKKRARLAIISKTCVGCDEKHDVPPRLVDLDFVVRACLFFFTAPGFIVS